MEQGILAIQHLPELITAVRQAYTVYAPAISATHDVTLTEITAKTDIPLDFVNTTLSPKGLFLPQCEVLYGINQQGVTTTPPSAKDVLAFAVRPCDADACQRLDKVFDDPKTGLVDPYVLERRQHSLLLTLACNNPCSTCFCTSVNSGPHSENGSDILMTQLDNHLLFKACTAKGQAFMQTYARHFQPATAADQQRRTALAEAAVAQIKPIQTEGLTAKLAQSFAATVWNDLFAPCLGCGVCTFVCPTCYCFDIVDETDGTGGGQRIRAWDACQFALFTLHASGHNPRPSKKERMRQRIMHKFSYAVENQQGMLCVGCGRCVRSCPVNLDIREMIETLRTWEEPEEF